MAKFTTMLSSWFGFGGRALGDTGGAQNAAPTSAIVGDVVRLSADGAMQLSAVWSCVDRRAKVVGSLPFFVYETDGRGLRQLARDSRLWSLLHESPNSRMTPFEFWRAMMMNHDLRGNAYARLDRDEATGEVVSMWPMPADQVTPVVMADGSMVYEYRFGGDLVIIDESNVLHLKDLGNGTVGLPRIEYMAATTTEAVGSQTHASRSFANGGKPTGTLMLDRVLKPEQRAQIRKNFAEMAEGPMARLFLLEADMKYQPLTMSPEDLQLLDSRKFSVEEFARWFDMPPVLMHHANVTTWGSGIEQIMEGWHKLSILPLLKSIEQAVRKRVMTPAQRSRMSCEFSYDALLRSSLKDRSEIYAKQVQNGLKTRNECRQLENDPPVDGGDVLTVQSNLLPIAQLGQTSQGGGNGNQAPIAQ